MSTILQRPLACRNAHCGAFCSPADASFCGGNPSRCANYERNDAIYRETDLLDKVKKVREELEELATETLYIYDMENPYISSAVEYVSLTEVRELLDELIAEGEK